MQVHLLAARLSWNCKCDLNRIDHAQSSPYPHVRYVQSQSPFPLTLPLHQLEVHHSHHSPFVPSHAHMYRIPCFYISLLLPIQPWDLERERKASIKKYQVSKVSRLKITASSSDVSRVSRQILLKLPLARLGETLYRNEGIRMTCAGRDEAKRRSKCLRAGPCPQCRDLAIFLVYFSHPSSYLGIRLQVQRVTQLCHGCFSLPASRIPLL
ncbi:hypothetical protein GGS26DRAFT_536432 [Hypomontagnella submonticulosa]|nr:hypothetical protein GGS26DRAFT_536432 [Hypomontagnella submonticulosa]